MDLPILSVSLLNETVSEILEANFPIICVQGEISNFTQAFSGHYYFSLKDDHAQVRCVFFKGLQQRAFPNILKNPQGLTVLIRARVSLYAPRGDYQLIVEHMLETGLGALQQAFEALKKRLQQEGLFNKPRPPQLPTFPQNIGVITSPQGAALRDILSTLRRRYPLATVILYPTLVQGPGAAQNITQAIQKAHKHAFCELLILARGGGSLEDLWPFNEENVARALFACPIPIVTGIGHETDTTLADFVADLRAPTPTGAAELVTPHQNHWHIHCQQQAASLREAIHRFLAQKAQALDGLVSRLRHPKEKLQEQSTLLKTLKIRLEQALKTTLDRRTLQHQALLRQLQLLSPLTTLARGYSITRQAGQIITQKSQVNPNLPLEILLKEGTLVVSLLK